MYTQVSPVSYSSLQGSCIHFPTIDLTDGSVRFYDPQENVILMDSQIRDGFVEFSNGTRQSLCKNFVRLDEDIQTAIVFNLSNGEVFLVDISTGRQLWKSDVTRSFYKAFKSPPRGRIFLTWNNVSVEVDTWSGKWLVNHPDTGGSETVVKVEHGKIYLPSGSIVSIVLKIRNPNYVLTLEPYHGTISIFKKATGHMYGRLSYASTKSTAEMVSTTEPSLHNLEVLTTTEATGLSADCNFLPVIDLTNGTIYIYDITQRKIHLDSMIHDGRAYYRNGSSLSLCDNFVAYNNSETPITMVNLKTGDAILMDKENKTRIYKSDVYEGFPVRLERTRVMLAWEDMSVWIDTRSGNWFIEDINNGKLLKAERIQSGNILKPEGVTIPIKLKINNKAFALILEPNFGKIGIYKKKNGKLYGRIQYPSLKIGTNEHHAIAKSQTTFLPSQLPENKVEIIDEEISKIDGEIENKYNKNTEIPSNMEKN